MADVSTTDNAGEGNAIKVFVRVRPEETEEFICTRVVEVNSERRELTLHSNPPRIFTFDHVAETTTQESMFSVVAKRLIDSCLSGYNGTIFAYGQTGSGKTFTMLGPSDSENAENFQHELRGIIPRSFEHLFNLIGREQELHGERKQFLTKCSFLELYQETVYDLLDTTSVGLQVRESIKHGVYVDSLKEVTVTSPFEAYQVLQQGWMNRRIAATSMNRESSRSHAIFTLSVESKEEKGGIQNVRMSRLNLVDLAGSERQRDANTVDLRLKEAGSINKSLSVLGSVIRSLVKKAKDKSQHVPYRNSRLTFLLRDSLGGNARTHIVACVHPGSKCFGETLSTLHFAQQAKMIKNKAVVNEDTLGNIMHLQSEIRHLKQQLLQYQTGAAPSPPLGEATDAAADPSATNASGASATRWSNLFVEAMQQVERLERLRQSASDTISQLENLNSKCSKMVQSSKMIIKLRDDRIARLERAAKEGIADQNTDALVADLKFEVEQLRQQCEHNPVELRLSMENKQLQNQLAALQASQRSDKVPASLAALETALRQLQAETLREKGGSTPTAVTPKGPDAVTTANLEKYKTQISNLQNELKSLQACQQTEREVAEKEKLEQSAELTALRKTVGELECALKAHHLNSRLERENHNQTLRNMATPPRNARYLLRSRPIPCSPSPGPTGDDGKEDSETLLSETPPREMADGVNEALAEEVKQLQDANAKLTDNLNDLNADLIRLRQDNTKLDTQNQQLSEVLSKERSQWSDSSRQRQKETQELQEQLEETTSDLHMHKEEVADLRVLLISSDKELKEARQLLQTHRAEMEKRTALQDTKMIQLRSELDAIKDKNLELGKENDLLQESMETALETQKFRLHEMERKLQTEEENRGQLEQQLETSKSTLATRETQYQHLKSMMDLADKHQEEMTARLLEDKASLQQQLAAQEEAASLLRQQLETAQSTITALDRTATENKGWVAALRGEVQALKRELTTVQAEKEEADQQVDSLQARLDHQDGRVTSLQEEVAGLSARCQADKNSYEISMSLVKDDLEFMTEMNESLQREMADQKSLLDKEQVRCEALTAQLAKLTREMEESAARHQKALEELTARLREAQSRIEPSESQAEELAQLLDDRTQELDVCKANQMQLQELLDDYESYRQQNQEEITNLKNKVKDLEVELEEKEKLRALTELLQQEKVTAQLQAADQQREMEAEMAELKSRLAAICQAVEHSQTEKHQTVQELNELKQTTTVKEFQLQQQQEDVERLQELVLKYHSQMDALQSKLEEAAEDKAKMAKVMRERSERCEELEVENAKLVGHQNPKQKIQYHVTLKEENNHLKEQLAAKVAELQRMKCAQRTPKSQSAQGGKGIRDSTNTRIMPANANSFDEFSSPGNMSSPR